MILDLCKPISNDAVAGVNIEYDDEFVSLLALLQERPEQQYGDVVVEAATKDWDAIYQASYNILDKKSKDLLVMGILTQSAIVLHGLGGLQAGLSLIVHSLENYWDQIFPRLYDEDDVYDPDYRLNAFSIFFTYDGIIRQVRQANLVKNGLSGVVYKLGEVENLLSNKEIDYPGGEQRLVIDLRIAQMDDDSEICSLESSLKLIQTIKSIFQQHQVQTLLKFDELEKCIGKILSRLHEVGKDSDASDVLMVDATTHEEQGISSVAALNWVNYNIESREDVQFLFEKICVYFEKHEPSHPAPLFIRRIQRLMNLNFYEIMKDISPDSLGQLENLVGQPINIDDDI